MTRRNIHPTTRRAFGVVVLASAGAWWGIALAAPKTSVELRAVFEQPWPLLGVMYAGALASALKTVGTARRSGSRVTPLSYLQYWPETLTALAAVFAAWLGLLMLDQLNFAAAAAWGAASNTFADIIRADGRTEALSPDASNGKTRPQASGG